MIKGSCTMECKVIKSLSAHFKENIQLDENLAGNRIGIAESRFVVSSPAF